MLLSVFWGMFAFNLVRGDMHATRANVDELLAIAQRLATWIFWWWPKWPG